MAELLLTTASLNAAIPPVLATEVAKVITQTKTSLKQHVDATKAVEDLRKTNDKKQTKAQLDAAKAYATSVDNRKTDMVVTSTAAPAMEELTPSSVEHEPEFGAEDEMGPPPEAMMSPHAEIIKESEQMMYADMYQQIQSGNLSSEEKQEYMEALSDNFKNNEDAEFEIIYGFDGSPVYVCPKPKSGMDWLKASGSVMWNGMGVVGDYIYDQGAMVVDAFGNAISSKGEEIMKAGEQFGDKFGECGEAWANLFDANSPSELLGNLVTASSATIALCTSAIDTVATTLDPTFLSDAVKQLGLELPIDTGLLTNSIEGIVMRAIDDPSSLANVGDVLKQTGCQMLTKATGGLTNSASSLISKKTNALTKMIGNTISKSVASTAMTKMNSALSAKLLSTSNGLAKRVVQRATTKVTNRVVSAVRDKITTIPCNGKGSSPVINTILNQVALASSNTVRNTSDSVRRNNLNTMIDCASMNINYEDVALKRANVEAKYDRVILSQEQLFRHMANSSL